MSYAVIKLVISHSIDLISCGLKNTMTEETPEPLLLSPTSIKPQEIILRFRIMLEMSERKKVCKLCGLRIKKPLFSLKIQDGEPWFYCEGCKSIYQLLHRQQTPPKLIIMCNVCQIVV